MSGETLAILDEIIALEQARLKRPDEFSITEYMEWVKVARPTAQDRLTRYVEQGMLTTRLAYCPVTRRQVRVYKRASETGAT